VSYLSLDFLVIIPELPKEVIRATRDFGSIEILIIGITQPGNTNGREYLYMVDLLGIDIRVFAVLAGVLARIVWLEMRHGRDFGES
jgi:hypothetical protein